jgi:predicted outer membrane repeat protein
MKKIALLVCGCLVAAALQAQVLHVPADYPTIQQGIDAADPGDTVLVADGIYYEQISFLGKKPLLVASEFVLDGDENHIANTVIDGTNLPDSKHASVVYFTSGEDTTSVLCGFTIREGKGTYYETIFATDTTSVQGGGGIFIAGSGAKIIHNHITQNHLDYDSLALNPDLTDGSAIATNWEANSNWVVVENNIVDFNTCSSADLQSGGSGVNIYCNARIANNVISENTSIGYDHSSAMGGGLACANDPAWENLVTVMICNNEISRNKVQSENSWCNSAGVYLWNVKGEFRNNIVKDNEVITNDNYGGGASGLLCWNSPDGLVISGNTFSGNYTNLWGTLVFEGDAQHIPEYRILVENNYFTGNEACYGGALVDWNYPLDLRNNVFSGNQAAGVGGAVYIAKNVALPQHHMVRFINNSFHGNSATSGGAIYSIRTNPLVINSIFDKDGATVSGKEIFLAYPNDTVEITNCDLDMEHVHGNIFDGGGNIFSDPAFEDTLLLTLRTESPCINSGTASYTCNCGVAHECPPYDIAGNARPYGGIVDMGAYEKSQFEEVTEPPESQVQIEVYPNPAIESANFEYVLESPGQVRLEIFNLAGIPVVTLANGYQASGMHKVAWNTADCPAGIYFCRLTLENSGAAAAGKLVILKK